MHGACIITYVAGFIAFHGEKIAAGRKGLAQLNLSFKCNLNAVKKLCFSGKVINSLGQ